MNRWTPAMAKLGTGGPEPLHVQPNCIKCGEKMWFSCTEIEKPGFWHHVYECKMPEYPKLRDP